jgi:hypothetical protein
MLKKCGKMLHNCGEFCGIDDHRRHHDNAIIIIIIITTTMQSSSHLHWPMRAAAALSSSALRLHASVTQMHTPEHNST